MISIIQIMDVKLEQSWKDALKNEFEKPYFENLVAFVKHEYSQKNIFPSAKFIFRALDECPVDHTKVVILGQDPYPTPGNANGLAFAVNEGMSLPASLKNIYTEIEDDVGVKKGPSGDLSSWAKQGVLLLNSSLTVQSGNPASHSNKGWEEFTDAVINYLNTNKQGVVYLLWGSYAQQKGTLIDRNKNLVLEAPHPSPLSAHRGFFGCKHFSKTNAYLIMHGKDPILW